MELLLSFTMALLLSTIILYYFHVSFQELLQKQENKKLKIDVDIGMKKAQKQEIIQDARRFGVLYPIPTFH